MTEHAPLAIETVESAALDAGTRDAIIQLCLDAYDEDLAQYLVDLGPGTHYLGRADGVLVCHAVVVPRQLQGEGGPMMHTAFIEMVATHPTAQLRGYASTLLRRIMAQATDFDLGGLSASDWRFYARLGWELWRGPLAIRTGDGLLPTPEDEVMIYRLPRTPGSLNLDTLLTAEWRAGELW